MPRRGELASIHSSVVTKSGYDISGKGRKMYDLIYAEQHQAEMITAVRETYPDAKIEDASDYIHRGRFSVEIGCADDEWSRWLFHSGIFEFSLHMQTFKLQNPDEYLDMMRSVVAEVKAESEEQS